MTHQLQENVSIDKDVNNFAVDYPRLQQCGNIRFQNMGGLTNGRWEAFLLHILEATREVFILDMIKRRNNGLIWQRNLVEDMDIDQKKR